MAPHDSADRRRGEAAGSWASSRYGACEPRGCVLAWPLLREPPREITHGRCYGAAGTQAKIALASCANIDECQDWANKAEALASYAKMADDDTLRALADRIQARAVRRMGELLKEFDARGGDRSKTVAAHGSAPSQRDAAAQAGLSEHQQLQAVRVANVPPDKIGVNQSTVSRARKRSTDANASVEKRTGRDGNPLR
jgi:hypothetical protein